MNIFNRESRLLHFGMEMPQHEHPDGKKEAPEQKSQNAKSSFSPDRAKKMHEEFASHNAIEEDEKKTNEDQMDQQLNAMDDSREDNTISLEPVSTIIRGQAALTTPNTGDVVLQFPDGRRSLWRLVTLNNGNKEYNSTGGGRIIAADTINDILSHPQGANARYRIAP